MEVLILFWVLCGIAGAMIASNKGNDAGGGCLLGGLFGPIGLLIVFAMAANEKALEQKSLAGGEMRKCPMCAELIRTEARKCRFCGTEVSASH